MLGKIDSAVKNDKQQVEIYGDGRYLVTGRRIEELSRWDLCRTAHGFAVLTARAAIRDETGDGGGKAKIKPQGSSPTSSTPSRCKICLHGCPTCSPAKLNRRAAVVIGCRRKPSDVTSKMSITVEGIVDFEVADEGDRSASKRMQPGCSWSTGNLLRRGSRVALQATGNRATTARARSADPMETANALIRAVGPADDLPVTHRHRGAFWAWESNYFKLHDDEVLRTAVWKFLAKSRKRTEHGPKPYKPKSVQVSNIVDALTAACQLPPSHHGPDMAAGSRQQATGRRSSWPVRTACCMSPVGTFIRRHRISKHPQRPPLRSIGAPTPEAWLRFLDQVLEDADAIEALQDWMGYTLTPDTSQQKILMCYGQPRSGKGTYARIHTALLGEDSVAGPTMSSLAENFGLEPLVHETAGHCQRCADRWSHRQGGDRRAPVVHQRRTR